MVTVEPLKEGLAGATRQTNVDVKAKIFEYSWWLRKEGYKLPTIKGKTAVIKRLSKLGADLLSPESVKETIARQDTWSEGSKAIASNAYSNFLQMLGLTWVRPRYKITPKLPFIPIEEELDALINACGKVTGAFLQGLKDTAADPGELARIKWVDINFEARTITLNYPVKGHNPRILAVSEQSLRRIGSLPRTSETVFRGLCGLSANYYKQRTRIAVKLSNPRLRKICFTTLRHWKATMEYHRTKDIIHVKQMLGHKAIQNTMVYINLEQALFKADNDKFHVKVAHNVDEACELIEAGFEYVTGAYVDGGKIFRKRK